jgi:hypothetical protein
MFEEASNDPEYAAVCDARRAAWLACEPDEEALPQPARVPPHRDQAVQL